MTGRSMDAGALRTRLTLHQAIKTGDAGGGASVTWMPVSAVWARVDPSNAGEADVGGHLDGVVTHAVTIRHNTNVESGMRFVDDTGRVLRVLAVHDPDGRRHYHLCRCEEEKS